MNEDDNEILQALEAGSKLERASIVEALLRAHSDAEAILALVRRVGTREAAVAELMQSPFGFSPSEAQNVMDMRFADMLEERRTTLLAELASLRQSGAS